MPTCRYCLSSADMPKLSLSPRLCTGIFRLISHGSDRTAHTNSLRTRTQLPRLRVRGAQAMLFGGIGAQRGFTPVDVLLQTRHNVPGAGDHVQVERECGEQEGHGDRVWERPRRCVLSFICLSLSPAGRASAIDFSLRGRRRPRRRTVSFVASGVRTKGLRLAFAVFRTESVRTARLSKGTNGTRKLVDAGGAGKGRDGKEIPEELELMLSAVRVHASFWVLHLSSSLCPAYGLSLCLGCFHWALTIARSKRACVIQ
ncbi:hypothetical protein DFH07DRAFT_459112 [Mycena maculata]|uniref:Uncharacterized protein n=1 Tax=Mycena maculata TaxID=230809 RepID=A0AAD7NFL7_9AGAR|nr:hypothetical protein DFH07DRAFT_459112 [Mycena maculata]